jgi:pSer/pThr/pTyr-binding forkhead associated (FHA) protein
MELEAELTGELGAETTAESNIEIAVEVFEQGQHRSFVVRCTQSIVRIGRGWNNDVIIRDPLIDAEHLELFRDESGSICIRDKQSLNGTRLKGRWLSDDSKLQFNVPIRVGHSSIVVHKNSEAVAVAEPTPQFEPVIERMQQPLVASIALALTLLVAFLSGQFAPDISIEGDDRIGRAMLFGLALIFWSALWGVIARLLRHEMAFWGHLTLVSALCSLLLITDRVIEWASFNTLSLTLSMYGYTALFSIALICWLFIGLDMSTRLKPLRRAAISAGITGLVILVTFVFPIGGRQEPDPSAPPMVNITQPPSRLVVGDISVDEFIDRSSTLFSRLQEKVEEEQSLEE